MKKIIKIIVINCFVLSFLAAHAQNGNNNGIGNSNSPLNNAWNINGNTISSDKFLGTTNPEALKFYTNNIERMRIEPKEGLVGIGTTNPNAKLHVVGNTILDGTVSFGNRLLINGATSGITSLDGRIVFGDNELSTSGKVVAKGFSFFNYSGGDKMLVVDNNGVVGFKNISSLDDCIKTDLSCNVGIGTGTSPINAKLHVIGNSKFQGNMDLDGFLTVSQSLNVYKWGQFGTTTGQGGNSFIIKPDNGTEQITNLQYFDNALIFSNWNNQEALRMTENGNLGIGATSPEGKLHVNGNAVFGTQPGLANQALVEIRSQLSSQSALKVSNTAGKAISYILAYNGSSCITGDVSNGGSGTVVLRTFDGNDYTNHLTVFPDGNVKIGGSGIATEKLHVAGGIKIGNAIGSSAGTLQYNTTTGDFEGYTASGWRSFTKGLWQVNTSNDIYYNDGNVGIGTTTPLDKFQVNNNANKVNIGGIYNSSDLFWCSNYIGLNFGRESDHWKIAGDGAHNGGSAIMSNPGGDMYFINAESVGTNERTLTNSDVVENCTRMVIKGNGNVGIGTDNPQATLHVNGTVKLDGILESTSETDKMLVRSGDGQIGYKNIQSDLWMQSTSNTNDIYYNNGKVGVGTNHILPSSIFTIKSGWNDWMTFQRTADNGFWRIHNPSNQNVMMFGYEDASGVQDFDILVLENSGKVGIGTPAPTEKLHVSNGSIQIDGNPGTWTAQNWHPRFKTPVNSAWMTTDTYDGTNYMGIGMTNSGWYFISSADNGASSNARYPFVVNTNGLLTAREIEVSLTTEQGWPDFVFSNKSSLRTLSELETYINENNHLPDIPSAVQVEKEGIRLGEMSAKLLQKIEELTLYTIEQQKLIENLQKQVMQLTEQEK